MASHTNAYWNESISNNLFRIYRGIVEDNNSPSKDGRLKVRIFGIHSEDKNLVPTETLPWAEVMQSLFFGYGSGIGITSIPKTGTWVFVVLENDNPNNPIVIGAVAGKAKSSSDYSLPISGRLGYYDVNELANNGYPNNHVIETLNGHIIEIDESSGSEKIRFFHTNGNEILMNNNGITVTSIANRNEITTGKFTQTVLNTMEINANGAISINTSGSVNISSNGVTNILANNDVNLKSAAVCNIESASDTNLTVKGNLTANVTGTSTVTSTGAITITSSSTAKLQATSITLQSNANTMVI